MILRDRAAPSSFDKLRMRVFAKKGLGETLTLTLSLSKGELVER